jgi:hypothetical protein
VKRPDAALLAAGCVGRTVALVGNPVPVGIPLAGKDTPCPSAALSLESGFE